MTSTPVDTVLDQIRDVLAGHPVGSGYYQTQVGTDEAAQMAQAVLNELQPLFAAVFDAGVHHAETCDGGMTCDPRTANPFQRDLATAPASLPGPTKRMPMAAALDLLLGQPTDNPAP